MTPIPAAASDWYAAPREGRMCVIDRGFRMGDGSLGGFTLTYDKAGYRVELQNTHWRDAAKAQAVEVWYGGMNGPADDTMAATGGVETIPYVRFTLDKASYAFMRRHSQSMMRIVGAKVSTGMGLPSGAELAKFEECAAKLDAGTLEQPQNFNIDLD